MAFTAADVKNLREMTGVGMMDCKKALAASDGDMDKAVEYLREKGLASCCCWVTVRSVPSYLHSMSASRSAGFWAATVEATPSGHPGRAG